MFIWHVTWVTNSGLGLDGVCVAGDEANAIAWFAKDYSFNEPAAHRIGVADHDQLPRVVCEDSL